ncbi:MAG: hypothetical protein ACJ8KA_11090 [Sulfurifustis sp.]
MSDDKLKHKPQTKHSLSEVLKSLQDLIRNDLVSAKAEPVAGSPVNRQKPAASPPTHEPDSLNEALERLDDTITHNIIEPVERARETPPEPLLPDEELEIEWENESNSSAPSTETIEAAPPPASSDETIELPSLEPEISDVDSKPEDAGNSALPEIEVELAPPPADLAPEPVARTDDVVEHPSVSAARKVSGAQEELPFVAPSAEENVPSLDLAPVDATSLEEMTLTLEAPELEGASAADASEPNGAEPAKASESEASREARPPATSRELESRASPSAPAADKNSATTAGDPNVIEWIPPSLAKPGAAKSAPSKAANAPAGAAPATSPKAPPQIATPPRKTAQAEPAKRPVEPTRLSPAAKSPTREPTAKQPAAPERTSKPAPAPKTVPAGPTPLARPTAPSVKAPAATPPSAVKAANPPSALKPPPGAKPVESPKPAVKPAASKSVAPEQTEIPVLKEIAELAALSSTPLPQPGQARDIAIRVIARLNIERRKAGEMPLDIKTIERLQQYLAEALAKRALNKPE